jgi:hypothetical protein
MELDPMNVGSFLYPDPPETILILLIEPFADSEVVVYSSLSHSFCVYVSFSGFSDKEIVNVVAPMPEIV